MRKTAATVFLTLAAAYFLSFFVLPRSDAGVPCTLPFNLQNNTVADATQVMANYNAIVTCLGSAAAAGVNSDITNLTTWSQTAATIVGNPNNITGVAAGFTIQGRPPLVEPHATLDFLPCYDHLTNTIRSCTPGAIAGTNVSGVSSLGGSTGTITLGTALTIPGNVLTVGGSGTPVTFAQGGTGTTRILGPMSGLLPGKGPIPPATSGNNALFINPGSFVDASGTAFYTSPNTLYINLNSGNIIQTGGPNGTCLGGQVSGALGNSIAFDGVAAFIWMVKRNALPELLCAVTTSADVQAADLQATFTGGGSPNFTFPANGPFVGCVAAGGCGMTRNQTVYFTTTGTLPAGISPNTFYFIQNNIKHSDTTLRISLAINGAAINFPTGGAGTHTAHFGVQRELDLTTSNAFTALRQFGTALMWMFDVSGFFTGLPDFQPLGVDSPYIRLTLSEETAAYRILSNGMSDTFLPIDLSGASGTPRAWTANGNRNVTIFAQCSSTGGAGTAYITVGSSVGIPLCECDPGIAHYTTMNIPLDSNTTFNYRVVGGSTGAMLNLYILGYQWTGPH